MVHREDLVKGKDVDIVLDAKVRGAGRLECLGKRWQSRVWTMDVGIGYLLLLLSVYADELWDASSSGWLLEERDAPRRRNPWRC